MHTCGFVALKGECLTMVFSVLPSQALRSTGERVLPSRFSTVRAWESSPSWTRSRLSVTPASTTFILPSLSGVAMGSRTSDMRPSPLDRPQVEPVRADWEEVLGETQAAYEAWRTWPGLRSNPRS